MNDDVRLLRLVAIFHFLAAGVACCAGAFLGAHYALVSSAMDGVERLSSKGGPPPELLSLFLWIYPMLGAPLLLMLALNVLSGWLVMNRRGWTFTVVVSVLNMTHFPVGTAIGIYTFWVLWRPSVRETYALGDTSRPYGG